MTRNQGYLWNSTYIYFTTTADILWSDLHCNSRKLAKKEWLLDINQSSQLFLFPCQLVHNYATRVSIYAAPIREDSSFDGAIPIVSKLDDQQMAN